MNFSAIGIRITKHPGREDLFDRIERAAVAMIVVIGIFWLATIRSYRPDVAGILGVYTDLLILAAVGTTIFFLRTRGFAVLWALLLLLHPWFYFRWQTGSWEHGVPFDTSSMMGALNDWFPFTLALSAATWLAAFRDECRPLRLRTVAAAALLFVVVLVALSVLTSALSGTARWRVGEIQIALVALGIPVGVAFYHMRLAWSCRCGSPVT